LRAKSVGASTMMSGTPLGSFDSSRRTARLKTVIRAISRAPGSASSTGG
jgi:hypothetical protein